MSKQIKHTKESLIADLEKSGIDKYGTLLIHIATKPIGEVEGGADTVIDALCEYMKDGLLVVPCHTWQAVDGENPDYDVLKSEACVGIIPNLFRKRENVFRSLHPTHSLCAFGKEAQNFVAGQENFHTPCAKGSCYYKLYERNADVLLIGVTFACNTSVHCIEEVANVPNRIAKSPEHLRIHDYNGNVIEHEEYRHHNANSNLYVKLEPVMFAQKTLHEIKFGDAKTLAFKEKDLFDLTLSLLNKNIDLFGDDKPI